jgi:hypothetical protein
MYRLLSIGVNNGLTYAEKDAGDVLRFFTGGAGPITDEQATLLMGRGATVQAVAAALARLSWAPPDLFVFYFSGHGSTDGIQLADGSLSYGHLAAAFRNLRGCRIVAILDTCHAGSFRDRLREQKLAGVGALPDARWQELLAEAAPGARVYYAVPADRLSREGGAVDNGHFTFALLQGLALAEGDIGGYVSDHAAFAAATEVMGSLWPKEPLPEASGIRRDLPLALSQAHQPLGNVVIPWAVPRRDGVCLGLRIKCACRKHVPTKLQVALCDDQGNVIDAKEDWIVPGFDCTEYEQAVRLDPSRLLRHRPIQAALHGLGVRLWWDVRVFDEHDRELARESVPEVFRAA